VLGILNIKEREQGAGSRESGTGSREQGVGNREQGAGSGATRGTGILPVSIYFRAGRMPTLLILKLAVELASCQFQYIFSNKIFKNML